MNYASKPVIIRQIDGSVWIHSMHVGLVIPNHSLFWIQKHLIVHRGYGTMLLFRCLHLIILCCFLTPISTYHLYMIQAILMQWKEHFDILI